MAKMMTFGETMQAWREYRGLTQDELREQAGLEWLDISLIEGETRATRRDRRGFVLGHAPDVYAAYCLAKALGCTVEQLVEGIGPRQLPG